MMPFTETEDTRRETGWGRCISPVQFVVQFEVTVGLQVIHRWIYRGGTRKKEV